MSFFKKLLTSVLIFLLIAGTVYMLELVWIALADFLEVSGESLGYEIIFYGLILLGAILHPYIFFRYQQSRGFFQAGPWLLAILITYVFFGILYYLIHVTFPLV
jgi:hypothetical protein